MTTDQLKSEIEKVKALGCKLSDSQIEAIVLKAAARDAKKLKSTKEAFKVDLSKAGQLWGHGCEYSTQAEYQRSCLGKKFN